jgi:hypothetical protein
VVGIQTDRLQRLEHLAAVLHVPDQVIQVLAVAWESKCVNTTFIDVCNVYKFYIYIHTIQ